ncbi:hypothetical protein VKT23_019525 [Stygiomarasmius scandens]|uniref:Uncharacterized protein n=1 Tax=Marasmiellus scandens TaxID=2682957 RepID=A0ABR1IL59_9AGAR
MSHNSSRDLDNSQENDDDLGPIVLPAPDANQAVLLTALKKAQLQIQELKTRTAALRRENGELRARSASSNTIHTSLHAPTGPDAVLVIHRKRLVLFGKRWAIMRDPWLDQGVFLRPPPTDVPDPLSDARFKTFESYKDGTIAELYSYLDDAPDFKELAEKLPGFRDEFCKQVGNERASALKTIPKLWSAEAGEERAASVKFKSLLYGPGRTTVPKFPPILFNNQDTSTFLFFNPYQPKMIRATLFGPNSVIVDPENFKYAGGTVGMTWGVSRVNASCIAWSAMLLMFLLSPDKTFADIGAASKINYRYKFYEFRSMILEGERKSANYTKMLFSFYNQRVFQGLPSVVTEAHIGDDDSDADGDDEMTNMMTRLLLAGPSDLADSMTLSRSASISQAVTSAPLVHESDVMIHGALDPEITMATDLDTHNSNETLEVPNETTQNKRGRGRGRGGRGRGRGGHDVAVEVPRQTRTRTKRT